jgi:hypothetical protein
LRFFSSQSAVTTARARFFGAAWAGAVDPNERLTNAALINAATIFFGAFDIIILCLS